MTKRLTKLFWILLLFIAPVEAQTNFLQYNFKKVPGVSLTASTPATLTFTAAIGGCPPGIKDVVSGAWAPGYISGGTGTAEVVTPTGGTCTSGATSGTIQITPANNHGGAWSYQSATGGIRELLSDLPSTGGKIDLSGVSSLDIRVNPFVDNSKPLSVVWGAGTYNVYDTLTLGNSTRGGLITGRNIKMSCTPGTVFLWAGPDIRGKAKSAVIYSGGMNSLSIHGCIVDGAGLTDHGIEINVATNVTLTDNRVRNTAKNGIICEWCNFGTLDSDVVSTNMDTMTMIPMHGIQLADSAAYPSAAATVADGHCTTGSGSCAKMTVDPAQSDTGISTVLISGATGGWAGLNGSHAIRNCSPSCGSPGGQAMTDFLVVDVDSTAFGTFAGQSVTIRTGINTSEMIISNPRIEGIKRSQGIVSITNTNPTTTFEVTDLTGLDSGDTVMFSGASGGTWTNQNAKPFTMTITDATHFTIPLDSSGLSGTPVTTAITGAGIRISGAQTTQTRGGTSENNGIGYETAFGMSSNSVDSLDIENNTCDIAERGFRAVYQGSIAAQSPTCGTWVIGTQAQNAGYLNRFKSGNFSRITFDVGTIVNEVMATTDQGIFNYGGATNLNIQAWDNSVENWVLNHITATSVNGRLVSDNAGTASILSATNANPAALTLQTFAPLSHTDLTLVEIRGARGGWARLNGFHPITVTDSTHISITDVDSTAFGEFMGQVVTVNYDLQHIDPLSLGIGTETPNGALHAVKNFGSGPTGPNVVSTWQATGISFPTNAGGNCALEVQQTDDSSNDPRPAAMGCSRYEGSGPKFGYSVYTRNGSPNGADSNAFDTKNLTEALHVNYLGQWESFVATGAPPMIIPSTTKVTNLNVDLLDGTDWDAPGTIGGTKPGIGFFTDVHVGNQLYIDGKTDATTIHFASSGGQSASCTGGYTSAVLININGTDYKIPVCAHD